MPLMPYEEFRISYTSGQKALTKEEYRKVLNACETIEDRVLLMLAVSLGLRREDIVRVRSDNIDFDAGTLLYLEKKKGDRIRKVPIGPALKTNLKIYLNTLAGKGNPYIFRNAQKSESPHMSSKTAYNRFQKVCARAGVDPRPFHALRATCIKLKKGEGWTIEQVAALIGDTVATVQEHYATPSEGEIREKMETTEAI